MKRYTISKDVTLTVKGIFNSEEEAIKEARDICKKNFNDELTTSWRHEDSCSFSIKDTDWVVKSSEEIINKEFILNKLKDLHFKEIIPNLYRGVIKEQGSERPEWITNKIYFVFLEKNKGYYWREIEGCSYKDFSWMDSTSNPSEIAGEVKTFKIED